MLIDAHGFITNICTIYLSFDVFSCGYASSDKQLKSLFKDYIFFAYVSRYWAHHFRETVDEGSLKEQTLRFLEDKTKVACCTQASTIPALRLAGYSQIPAKQTSGLHLAASSNLPSNVQALLETKLPPNNQTSCGCTPLWLAAEQGYDDEVRLLLAANAILDLPDNSGTTPLATAVMNSDHTSTVNILLAANASIETTDCNKMTPVLWAARRNRTNVLSALLSANADPEKQCKGGCTALGWASRRGQDASIEILLAANVSTEAPDSKGRSPLILAAQRSHSGCAKLLLAKGANPNAPSEEGRALLSWAAEGPAWDHVEAFAGY